jgi:5'-nucleotidase (lipoprotein e(P4) family)
MCDRRILAFVCAVVVSAAGCGPATTQSPPQSSAPRPPARTEAARRTHENLNATVWMQSAIEYRASALQAYRAARVALDSALADSKETAAVEQTADASALPPAVILDLDETVLDNSPFEARMIADSSPERPIGYEETAWRRWVQERKAGVVPGAVEFLTYARTRGVTPFYVTNRSVKDADGHDTGEAATRDVLNVLRIPVEESIDTVLMRGENGWTSSDKGSRRAFVAKRYRILLLVGDNFEDFVSVPDADKSSAGRAALETRFESWWGAKWIVLPNPTYGSWEQALTFGIARPTDEQTLAAKYAALALAR